MATYNIAKTSNPLYMTYISVPTADLEIVCDTPEQFGFAVSSTWEARLPAIPGLSAATAARDSIAGGWGLGFINKEETRAVWQSTSPIEVSLTLLFDANESAYNDVYVPMMGLAGIALPEEGANGFLYPPGPTRVNNRNAVLLVIGKYWRMDDGLMTSVQPTFDTRIAEDGYPIAGQVEITVRGAVVYSRKDFIRLGMLPSGAFGQSS